MKVAIGNDHIAVEFKKQIVQHLQARGITIIDLGTNNTERTHYPIYAELVAHAVVERQCALGILLCGTGAGMAIAANKVSGIRAVVCSECYTARMARAHNNANVLALGAMVVGVGTALEIVDTFLQTDYEGGRHQQRLDMISNLENSE